MMVGPTNWRTVSTSPVVIEATGVELNPDVGADADVGIGFDAGETDSPLSIGRWYDQVVHLLPSSPPPLLSASIAQAHALTRVRAQCGTDRARDGAQVSLM